MLLLIYNEESVLLKGLLLSCLANPNFKPAALLHTVNDVSAQLLHEIERELHHFDDNLDFALEFNGARNQLMGGVQQFREQKLLEDIKEKPLSELTAEERQMLKKLGVK